jgi:hypothetical protein
MSKLADRRFFAVGLRNVTLWYRIPCDVAMTEEASFRSLWRGESIEVPRSVALRNLGAAVRAVRHLSTLVVSDRSTA